MSTPSKTPRTDAQIVSGDRLASANEVVTGGFARTLERELATAHHEAELLAYGIHSQNYVAECPNWKPLPDTIGILGQISNMVAGIQSQRDTAIRERDEARAQVHQNEINERRDQRLKGGGIWGGQK